MRFFWRIFLSAWAIALITASLTVWIARWLPNSSSGLQSSRYTEQIVELVAADLRARLSAGQANAGLVLSQERQLDFGPVLKVFVLQPGGTDVLGRALPRPVRTALVAEPDFAKRASAEMQWLHVVDEELDGYVVVGYEGLFLLGRLLVKPGTRPLLVLLAILVSAGVSLLLARFIVLPVHRLRVAGQQVAAGDLSVRVAHTVGSRTDDIAKLAHDFDRVTERVQDLLGAQQRMLRDVSHELRSPLARLQALMSIARQKQGDEEMLARMEVELERLDDLIGEILAYSRLESQEDISTHATDIVDLVQNIVDDASLEGQAAGKQISLQGPERLVVALDSGLVQRAIENVVRNALKHTADHSMVNVQVDADADEVRVLVDDQGPGIREDRLQRVFEPFYRVEDARATQSGSGGIGLAIAKRGVELHGGTITARNRDGAGLRVAISLPRVDDRSP